MGDAAIPLPADLQSALAAYKTNYAAYKVTGETAYKTAYEGALAAINAAIANVSGGVQTNDTFIQGFINSYTTTNRDITSLQARSRAIQTQGPKLQDSLAQSKQLHAQVVSAADETSLYVKAGIVVGLLVIVGIIGAL
jgi:CHASE3 domain sensor protein